MRSIVNHKGIKMNYLSTSRSKATVCTKGTCVTLFGPAAQFVTLVTVLTVVAVAASLISRLAD
ncbi:MAG: hypothetical protein P4L51_18300 [Puia sp.]|nr:hypothetical protein [Puia sp.]